MNIPDKQAAPQKLITCILPKGVASGVVESLRDDKNIISANIDYARGAGRLTPTAYRGAGEESEKEILTVAIKTEHAEAIFDWLFIKAKINRPHGGIMYMTNLLACTQYSLPDMDWEQ